MTATWIFIGLSAACWALFLYPYILYPRVLRLLSLKPIDARPVRLPVSLLFCAHNEIACLPEKIENLRALKLACKELQILSYDDASDSGTYELLTGAADLLTVIRGPGRTGKAAGMKRLVSQATGEVLVFTDANIMLSPDVIDRILPYYGDGEVGGVSGTIKTIPHGMTLTGDIGSAYLKIDDNLQNLESRTGNVMGASGGLFSVRREYYPEFPDTVQDDFTVSMSVVFQGKRLIKAPDVIAFERTVSRRDEELRRKVRIGARAFHTHRFLWPQIAQTSARDQMKYLSRKVLRWFGGVFIIFGALFGLAAVATVSKTSAVAVALLLVLITAASIYSTGGLLGRIGEMGLATFATLAGVLQGMRGRTMATWTPAKSR